MPKITIRIASTDSDFPEFCASAALKVIKEFLNTRSCVRIALPGGKTPIQIYKILAKQLSELSDKDLKRIYWFQTDERNVSPPHPESNQTMIFETFGEILHATNFFPVPVDTSDPQQAAKKYSDLINKQLANTPQNNNFEIIFLGVGNDGHIASLFPNLPWNCPNSNSFFAVNVEKLGMFRYSLTFDLIANAEKIIFFVADANKKDVLKAVKVGTPKSLPVVALCMAVPTEWWISPSVASAASYFD